MFHSDHERHIFHMGIPIFLQIIAEVWISWIFIEEICYALDLT